MNFGSVTSKIFSKAAGVVTKSKSLSPAAAKLVGAEGVDYLAIKGVKQLHEDNLQSTKIEQPYHDHPLILHAPSNKNYHGVVENHPYFSNDWWDFKILGTPAPFFFVAMLILFLLKYSETE